MPASDRFVRVPTALVESLLKIALNGLEWRILLWAMRATYGWNRSTVAFTWYQIAKEISASRPAVYRAGLGLQQAGILVVGGEQLGLQINPALWHTASRGKSVASRQLWMSDLGVANKQRLALPTGNAPVANWHKDRCLEATLFRRAKDIKDNVKTYKDTRAREAGSSHKPRKGAMTEHHPAGAARPIPNKYGSLSQD